VKKLATTYMAAISEVLQGVAEIPGETTRAEALAHLAHEVPDELQSQVLAAFIETTGRMKRSSFLDQVVWFAPLIAHLEGPSGASVLMRAICEAGKWFA
jgi:hypothetical protein